MASLSTCGSPSPATGKIPPTLIDQVNGLTIFGVLSGAQQLSLDSINYAPPLHGSPSPLPDTLVLRYDSSLQVNGSGELGVAGAPTPGAHATSHEPGGSDALDPSTFDGLIVPPIATGAVLGGVKDGDGVDVAVDGTLSLDLSANSGLEIASGAVQLNVGTGLTLTGGEVVLDTATDTVLGGVIVGTGFTVDGGGNLDLTVPVVTGTSYPTGSIVWDTSPNSTSPSPSLRLAGGFVYTGQIPYSQLPTAQYSTSPHLSPSPKLGMVRVDGPSNGLTLVDGLLSLSTPISSLNLPRATATGGQGIIKIPLLGTSGLRVVDDSTGEIALLLDATSATLTKGIGGVKVADNKFLPMTGTGDSPSPVTGYGWLSGPIRFQPDLGVPAIFTGNQRIRCELVESPSPAAFLYNADGNDLLTYDEINLLIAAGVAGFGTTTPIRPVQATPGTTPGSIEQLSVGDRFLTSTDSTTNPGGDWDTHNCEVATWTETAPDTFAWTFSTPTVNSWFVDEQTGDTWYVVVGGTPTREAFRYRTRNDDVASTGATGRVRVPATSGLVMDGEAIRLTLSDDIGASTGLKLVTRARTNALAIDLNKTQGILELSSTNQLQLATASVTGTYVASETLGLVHLAADQVTGGTNDFISTQYDGLSVRIAGDTEDFRTTGSAVGTATRILIHTAEGISIAEESINTDALADKAVSYSKLLLHTDSGIEDNGQDKIKVKLQTQSGLTLGREGLAVSIHDVVDDATIAVDTSTGGLRVKTESLTSAYFAPGLAITAAQLTLAAPMLSSSGLLTFCYQSPLVLTGSPGCLTIGAGLITSPYIADGSIGYDKLCLASPSGVESSNGCIAVALGTGLAFSGNDIIASQVPGDALVLAAGSALYAASPVSPSTLYSLALQASSPFTQSGSTLDLADSGVYPNHLAQWKVRTTASASGLEQGADSVSGSPTWASSPGFLSSVTGLRVATRTRADHDYFEPAGQGQGTIEPYSLTLAEAGGAPSGSAYQGRMAPTPNSIGLQHLALGNETLAPTDADRLPTGLGSYKALVQTGKLASSPVTTRGWAVADLSDDVIAVKVGPGLSILSSGYVVPSEVRGSQLRLSAETDEAGTPAYSGEALVAFDDSPGRTDTLALAYDPADFTASAATGLSLKPQYQQEFTGASIPTISSGQYAFSLTLAGSPSLGISAGSVELFVNGLRLESPFYSYSSPSVVDRTVWVNRTASPGPNLAYDLVQNTSPDVLDRVVIQYRTRPI
jgi:hypothetical protein